MKIDLANDGLRAITAWVLYKEAKKTIFKTCYAIIIGMEARIRHLNWKNALSIPATSW